MKSILFILACVLAIAMFCPHAAEAQCSRGVCGAVLVQPVAHPIANAIVMDHPVVEAAVARTVSVLKKPIVIAHNSRQRRVERDGWYAGKLAGRLFCCIRCR